MKSSSVSLENLWEALFELDPSLAIHPLLKSLDYPWFALKLLKDFLNEIVPKLPKEFPLNEPLTQDYFLSDDGTALPLKETGFTVEEALKKGSIVKAGAIFTDDRVFLEKGVIVEPFALVAGPCYFSEGTQVRHGAYVRGSVFTGKGAVIGHTTEVKNSIFLNQAKAAHFAYVGDSFLGNYVNLGAGTKLANLKFLKREVTFSLNGEVLHTKMKKLGAILGDASQTGCNAVLQPGTVLGKGSFVFPGKTAGPGIFPPKTKVK